MKHLQNRFILVAAALLITIGISACGLNIYPVSKDIQLGKQVSKEIDNNKEEYPVLEDQEATQYIQNIINELLKSSHIKYRKEFKYQAKIIKNDSVVNAFCLPGGYIYVYTGLIKLLDYESTFAAVIAHEIAHAEKRHATQRMTKALGIQVLSSVIVENNKDSEAAKIATNLFSGLALLQNSRQDEYEADHAAFSYLESTEWYPGGIKMFFEKLKATTDGSSLEMLLSTHPMPKDRVDEVNRMLKEANVPPPTEENLKYIQYKQYKNYINSLY